MTTRRGGVGGRLGHLLAGQRDADQQRLYEAITGGKRAAGPGAFDLVDGEGALLGPFEAMLRSPAVGQALQALGSAIRYESALSDRIREMAILATAATWDSAFERHAHEAVGRTVGLDDDEMRALRAGGTPELADPTEALAMRAIGELLQRFDLDDQLYAELVDRIGEQGVFELTTLVGYYSTLALQLRVFRVPAPDSGSVGGDDVGDDLPDPADGADQTVPRR